MILSMQKEKKYIIQGSIFFVLFLGLYTVLDYLNIGYQQMVIDFGWFLVIGNIILNIVMAFISAFMWNISTYGCTPCVIAFFSTIGITFAVAALPLAGLPYKLIALLLLIAGFFWLKYESNHVKCKINTKE
jgi:hypothetical protein